MGAGKVGRDPALRRSIDEPETQQERLVDVLDGLDLLGQHRGQRGDADRPRGELLDDRRQELPVGRIEPLVVDLHGSHRGGRGRLVDVPVAVDLGVVAHPLEEPIDDARGAAAPSGDGAGRGRFDGDLENGRRPLDDRGQLGLGVEVEPVGRTKAVAQGELMRPARVVAPTTVNGLIGSVAWAIAGSNAGMYLAVALATSAYRGCLQSHSADSGECRTIFHQDWATYSGDRLGYAALVGLAPIPVGWLAGWFFVRQLRKRPQRQIARMDLVGKSPALSAR